jgi:hypothetical protein
MTGDRKPQRVILGRTAVGLMGTSASVILGSPQMAEIRRQNPLPIAPARPAPPRRPLKQNASATRVLFGSKYPGTLLRAINAEKGVGRPPAPKPDAPTDD